MAKIVIISGLQVVDNPRVVKEADALSEAGHDVEVLAALYEPDAAARVEELLRGRSWRHTPVLDLVSRSIADRLTAFRSRVLYRVARPARASSTSNCRISWDRPRDASTPWLGGGRLISISATFRRRFGAG
jgi:hypothetical protein